MELSFPERLAVLSILPQESDYATLRIGWRARILLAPTDQETKEFEIKQDGTQVRWNPEKAKSYTPDIPLDDSIITLIRQTLIELDHKKKLNTGTYSIYEKFVMGYQQL
jgi:hypothetical protein